MIAPASKPRSMLPEVRNPLLELDEAKAVLAMGPEVCLALARLCWAIAKQGRAKSQKCWRQNKGPMALYWKVVGVYAYHLCRVLRSA